MKFTIEQITDSRAEEVLVKCCDSQAACVEKVRKVVSAQNTVGVYKNGAFYRLELSQKAWWIRTILHLLLLEIILLPLAHHWQFWFDARDAVVYAIFILIGKIFWHIVDYSKNVKTAADVNKKLKERRNNMIKESKVI